MASPESSNQAQSTAQNSHTVGQSSSSLKIAIGIATRGRPSILADTIRDLGMQTRQPDNIYIAYPDPSDVADAPAEFPGVRFMQSALGLTRQRNMILDALDDESVVVFLDDDFYLHPNYLAIMENLFSSRPEVVVATGNVLEDGINGPGLTYADAHRALTSPTLSGIKPQVTPFFNAYGCNMCLRVEPIRANRLRFDEDLPFYGWYEDVDFSRRLARFGEVVRVSHAFGVHLGAKSGRQSGVKLGYSQVANPLYLVRKRSVSWPYAIASMSSRSMKNLVKSFNPEPYVDRRGRLRGNLLAWREVLEGKSTPTRILEL
jgi:GT2 family glycosyltransferase